MNKTVNKDIRDAAKCAGVRLWQVAEMIGVNDGNFSRKLRKELPQTEKQRILAVIECLAHNDKGAI
jgi:hypothetical protein